MARTDEANLAKDKNPPKHVKVQILRKKRTGKVFPEPINSKAIYITELKANCIIIKLFRTPEKDWGQTICTIPKAPKSASHCRLGH